MAYRRRQQQGILRPSTLEGLTDEGMRNPPSPSSFGASPNDNESSFSSSSLAAKAIRASSARCDSSLSSVYSRSNFSHAPRNAVSARTAPPPSKDSRTYKYTSMEILDESKHGFWGVLARKAKSILDDDNTNQQSNMPGRMGPKMPGLVSRGKFQNSNHLEESNLKRDNPTLLKGLDAITSSLSHIGGTIGKSLEDGFTIVENRTSDIIQETCKHIKKKPGNIEGQNQETNRSSLQQTQLQTQMHPQSIQTKNFN